MKITLAAASIRTGITVFSLAALFAANSQAQHYTQTNLVSNMSGAAAAVDADLINAWGLSRSSTGPWWVADNGTGKSTLYSGTGGKIPLTVTVPGFPTGTVFNGTGDFALPGGGGPTAFLFASEDGTISGWTPGAPSAEIVVSRAHAVYKGLAIAEMYGEHFLYATDFHAGVIDVFDSRFQLVDVYRESFRVEAQAACADLVPFNVQNIGGNLYVTFAKQDAKRHDEIDGPGLGLVAVFRPNGKLLKVFHRGPWLNAPWGLALAPGDFGSFSHTLLVGQFGSGQITAYDMESGRFRGFLRDPSDNPIWIDGLWAISFGNGQAAGAANALYFAAGPNGESNGLFGMLAADSTDQVLGNGN